MICTCIRGHDGTGRVHGKVRPVEDCSGIMEEITKVKRKMSSQVDTGTGEACLIALLFLARDTSREAMHLHALDTRRVQSMRCIFAVIRVKLRRCNQ